MSRKWVPTALLAGVVGLSLSAVSRVGAAEPESPAPAYLGVVGSDTPEGTEPMGSQIKQILPGSPAAAAGLKPGDVITDWNKEPITAQANLVDAVRRQSPGDKVTVKYWRDGAAQETTVELRPAPETLNQNLAPPAGLGQVDPGLLPSVPSQLLDQFGIDPQRMVQQLLQDAVPGTTPAPAGPMIGVQLQEMDEPLRQRLGVADNVGVVVADIVPNSPAEKAGLKSSDVIIEADGQAIADPAALREHVAAKKIGDRVNLKWLREGKAEQAEIELAAVSLPNPQPRFYAPPAGNPFGFDPNDALPGMRMRTINIAEMEQRIAELEKQVQQLQRTVEQLSTATPPSTP